MRSSAIVQVGAWYSKYYGKGELAKVLVYSHALPAGTRESLYTSRHEPLPLSELEQMLASAQGPPQSAGC